MVLVETRLYVTQASFKHNLRIQIFLVLPASIVNFVDLTGFRMTQEMTERVFSEGFRSDKGSTRPWLNGKEIVDCQRHPSLLPHREGKATM